MVAEKQPMKLASLEGQFKTERGAPLRIGGLPFPDQRETKFALEIPYGLSLLAFHRPDAVIKGLEEEPASDWPNVQVVHICFQIMVGCGSVLSLFALVAGWFAWRRPPLSKHLGLMKVLVVLSPLGFVALEAGWMVTELGRQPWIIYHLMRTKDAVTSVPNIAVTLATMTVVYVVLAVIALWLLWRHVIASPDTKDIEQTGVLV
jgi:cytochrome d ubiquinol oxidase subunit I